MAQHCSFEYSAIEQNSWFHELKHVVQVLSSLTASTSIVHLAKLLFLFWSLVQFFPSFIYTVEEGILSLTEANLA